jgi:hypothetical protein
MFVLVSVGRWYRAASTAKRLVEVKCEKCQNDYFYELVRSGTGAARAPYFLGEEAAQRRAQTAANEMVGRRLQRDAEMVPCPKCHWVNQDLIEGYRRSRYGWVLVTGAVIGGLVLITVALVGLAMYQHHSLGENLTGLLAWALPAVALIVGSWWLRQFLRGRIDPNVSYPREPELPAGTPMALVKSRSAAGEEVLLPARETSAASEGWITFRAGELRLPRVCCECLRPLGPDARLRSSAKGELALFLCRTCRSASTRRMWYKAFERLALALALAWLVFLIPGVDRLGHWVMCALAAMFMFLVGLFVNAARARPYVVKQVDARRLVYRLRMRNPRLHAMVWAEMRPKEVARV